MVESAYCIEMSIILNIPHILRHLLSIKSLKEEYLPVAAAVLIDRSVGRGRGLLLLVGRSHKSCPDSVRRCTRIHKIGGVHSLHLEYGERD